MIGVLPFDVQMLRLARDPDVQCLLVAMLKANALCSLFTRA
jgi:hypothetical protein